MAARRTKSGAAWRSAKRVNSAATAFAGLLRSNGLRAAVSADDAGGVEPQLQLQGVRVLVASSDEAAARQLLAEADDAPS